jgi:hypothetical protein
MKPFLEFAVLLLSVAHAQSGGFQQLVFEDNSQVSLGALTFHLSEPDRSNKPTEWQGPLTISTNGKSCEARVSLVSSVYASTKEAYVVVVTHSGSNTLIHFIDTSSCAAKWQRIKAFTEGVRIAGDRLTILPTCVSTDSKFAQCFSARIYKLNHAKFPQLLKDASIKLTQETLGVAFSGEANVENPKTPQARLVPSSTR